MTEMARLACPHLCVTATSPTLLARGSGEPLNVEETAVQKIRSRVINFRVTEEEFNRLKTTSNQQGARCLSEYARDVLMQALDGRAEQRPGAANGQEKLLTLELRVGLVELGLSRLEGRVSSLFGRDEELESTGRR